MPNTSERRFPLHPAVTEDMIRELVHGFYARVRRDCVLGPIFHSVIGEDWSEHLARMCDFWSSVMLTSGRYKGNPMAAHIRLQGVTPENFDAWLALFREAAQDICGAELAPLFLERARTIAGSLKLGMFYRPAPKTAG